MRVSRASVCLPCGSRSSLRLFCSSWRSIVPQSAFVAVRCGPLWSVAVISHILPYLTSQMQHKSGASTREVYLSDFCWWSQVSGYLSVPGTQLNKQQLTTARISVEQSCKASGVTPHWGSVGRASWSWGRGEVTCYVCELTKQSITLTFAKGALIITVTEISVWLISKSGVIIIIY